MFDKIKSILSPSAEYESVKEVEAVSNLVGTPLFSVGFDGEKVKGEIGVIKDYHVDYLSIRARSWQFYLDNSITHLIINRFVSWVAGSGLKVQSEILDDILSDSGISIDSDKVSSNIESRFKLFCGSNRSSYNELGNINLMSSEVIKNAYVSGDCLVVQRVKDGVQSVQIIDGSHVQTPYLNNGVMHTINKRGNRIVDGVEINKAGKHIAYHVKVDDGDFKRIKARDSRGRKLAFLVYGLKYREDDTRGIPLITAIMETLKKLDRYKEATVGSAEERQKIAYQIIHNELSSGSNPVTTMARVGLNKGDNTIEGYPTSTPGEIATTSEKAVFNMENGSELKQLGSDNELSFKEFHSTLVELACSTVDMPPEIAMSKFEGSYSGSRAAIKDWEHTLGIKRYKLGVEFYQPIYDLWLDYNVLNGNIIIDGYKQAVLSNNYVVLDSYRNARWVGDSVPHIDPVKEVQAERLKLGVLADHIPLTTVEMATENVKGGESSSNISQFIKEISKIEKSEEKSVSNKDTDNKEDQKEE